MKKRALVAMCVGVLAPSMSSAAARLEFGTGTAGSGGNLVDLGAIDPAEPVHRNGYGFDILIDSLVVTGTAFDGVYNVDGTLACPTGMSASCGALSFNTILRTISIVGSVPGLGVPATTLVLGSLDSFTFSIRGGSGLDADFHAFGSDTKDPALLTSLGLDPHTAFSYEARSSGFLPFDCGEEGHPTCWTVQDTGLLNAQGHTEVVPEPGTLFLLGGGLLGLAARRRRRREHQSPRFFGSGRRSGSGARA